MEIKNALIKKTMLGYEGHGIFTAFLIMDYGGIGQGFGGWAIKECASQFILGVLDCLELETWEEIPGKHCRVAIEKGLIQGIGHILYDDKWFYLSSLNPKEASTKKK